MSPKKVLLDISESSPYRLVDEKGAPLGEVASFHDARTKAAQLLGWVYTPTHTWVTEATNVALREAQAGRGFTTDDIWERLERRGVAPPVDRRLMGAIIQRLAKDGTIRKAGVVRSRRSENHHRSITMWIAR